MRIAVVAGELSGDQLGEGLVRLLRQQYPDAIIEGVAGPRMIKAGCNSLYPMEALSVMGIVEIIKHLPQILKVRRGLLKHFQNNRPDIYIGIDAPDFNLPIEEKLKKQGVKTIHYVSPSVWAWRESRIKKIKRATDVVFTILPFEESFYQKHHHKAVFVGHPLAEKIKLHQTSEDIVSARKNLALSRQESIIAILPGSRHQEVKQLLPIFLDSLCILQQKGFEFSGVLPVAKPILLLLFKQYDQLLDKLNIKLIHQQADIALQASDIVLVASGTATLEAMLYKKPMVVGYKVSTVTAWLVRRMITTKYVSLPNILANQALVPELLQNNLNAKSCADALQQYLDDPHKVSCLQQEFLRLHHALIANADQKMQTTIVELVSSF